ncbi:hypothetical protein CR513_14029, partial [Mucuna pruriens]
KYYLVDVDNSTFTDFQAPHKKNSLQSIIECTFGLCKVRWKIRNNMLPFAFKIQSQVIIACITLHNLMNPKIHMCYNDSKTSM